MELCCVNTELAFSLLCINSPLDVLLYIIQLMLFDLVSLSDIKPLLSSDDEDEEEFQSHSSPQKDFRQGRRQVVPPVVLGAPVALPVGIRLLFLRDYLSGTWKVPVQHHQPVGLEDQVRGCGTFLTFSISEEEIHGGK